MYYKESKIYIEELNRYARLYIGLPEDYESSTKKYPVLYMHDGHNVFSDKDAFAGVSWGLIEAYEKDTTLPELIVVGLECAEGFARLDEYCPFEITFPAVLEQAKREKIGGKGDLYLKYITEVLKPKIDMEYRTLKEAEYTGIMGSSMGGIISLYAALKYNHVFSRVASVSGSYFVALEQYLKTIEESQLNNIIRLYMDAGTKEVGVGDETNYIETNLAVYENLTKKLPAEKLSFQLIEGGIHHESDWRKRLPNIIKYLFSNKA